MFPGLRNLPELKKQCDLLITAPSIFFSYLNLKSLSYKNILYNIQLAKPKAILLCSSNIFRLKKILRPKDLYLPNH